MAFIECTHVSLDYPIYNAKHLSLRHAIVNLSTGGLVAKGVNKTTVVKALNGISFRLSDGDRVGVLGHNGAGKTTLLRCLSGIYQPTSGYIEYEGTITPLIEIGAGIEPELSGYDNIRRLQLFYGFNDNLSERTKYIADFSELGSFLSLPVRTYSSGMMMRLMFAIATSIEPDILIMDEFFSVGDNDFREKAEAHLVKKINKASILVFASHSEDLLKKYCNRFFRLDKGSLEEVYL